MSKNSSWLSRMRWIVPFLMLIVFLFVGLLSSYNILQSRDAPEGVPVFYPNLVSVSGTLMGFLMVLLSILALAPDSGASLSLKKKGIYVAFMQRIRNSVYFFLLLLLLSMGGVLFVTNEIYFLIVISLFGWSTGYLYVMLSLLICVFDKHEQGSGKIKHANKQEKLAQDATVLQGQEVPYERHSTEIEQMLNDK